MRDKVFLVTGASEGLGRAIAEAFSEAGAKVVMAARGEEALQEAAAAIRARGRECLAVPADVSRDEDVAALVARTVEHYGRLDGLVNNVGVSMRGTALETPVDEYRRLLELNLLTSVRCTRAAASQLIEHRGHLVNIGSLSGKIASRWLGAYPASKFALSAYTQQLRLELAPRDVHVLLVSPGPIAREKPRTYGADKQPALPEEARRPGGGAKIKAIDPCWLARRIVRACQRREPDLVVPAKARLLFALMQLSPRLGDWVLGRMT
jgi:NAD(P)-dependent dehydrogenase (short-subunit alcohol dehydrogenase family)